MKTIIILAIALVGCTGQHCIKVGGDYQGGTGSIEYCYNAPQSSETGLPVLDSATGEKSVLVPKSELEKLVTAAEKQSKEISSKTQARLSDRIKAIK